MRCRHTARRAAHRGRPHHPLDTHASRHHSSTVDDKWWASYTGTEYPTSTSPTLFEGATYPATVAGPRRRTTCHQAATRPAQKAAIIDHWLTTAVNIEPQTSTSKRNGTTSAENDGRCVAYRGYSQMSQPRTRLLTASTSHLHRRATNAPRHDNSHAPAVPHCRRRPLPHRQRVALPTATAQTPQCHK